MKMTHLHVNYADEIPFIDEGNLVITCKLLSASRLTPDSFLDESILPAHYKDGDFHTMYVGEILQIMAR